MQIDLWLALGFVAQACFFSRFFIQWIASERAGKIIIPPIFWHLSIIGALGLLSYAIYRSDPVFIIGQAAALFVYMRNMHLENGPHTKRGAKNARK